MKKAKKTVIIMIIVLLSAAVGSYLYIQSRKFNQQLETLIRTKLSDYAGREVEIDRISTDIFNRVIISGVRIMDNEERAQLLRVERILVSYSLVDLFRDIRAPERLISSITFFGPEFTVDASGERIILPGLENLSAAGSGNVPPWTIRVVRGEIQMIEPGGHRYLISPYNGVVMLGGYPEIYSESDFRVAGMDGSLALQGGIHAVTGDFSGNISLEKINIDKFRHLASGELAADFPSGRMEGALRFGGNTKQLQEDARSVAFNGDMEIKQVRWRNFDLPRARINVSPRRLLVEDAVLRWENNSLAVKGVIDNYLYNPVAGLKVKGDIDIARGLEERGIDYVTGLLKVDGKITGTLEDYELSGSLFMDSGNIAGRAVSDLRTFVSYREDKFQISSGRMKTAGGSILWEGELVYPEELYLKARLEGIEVEQILKTGGITGDLDGDIDFGNSWSNPRVSADFSCRDLKVGYKKFGHVSLEAAFADENISVDGFTLDGNYLLSADSVYDPQKKRVSDLRLSLTRDSDHSLLLGGEFTFSPLRGALEFEGENVLTSDIPSLEEIYPDSSGGFYFSGNLDFRPGRTFARARINTDNFKVDDTGYNARGRLSVLLKDNGKRLYGAQVSNLNDYFSGRAEVEFDGNKYKLKKASASFSGADLGQLGILTKSSDIMTSGKVDGYAIYTDDKRRGELQFDNPGLYGKALEFAQADLSFAGDSINLVSMNVVGGEGEAEITGEVYPDQNINMFARDFKFKDREVSFSGRYRGGRASRYGFQASAADITVDGIQFEDISLRGESGSEHLRMYLESGTSLQASLSAGAGEEGKLEGSIDVNDFEITPVARMLEPERKLKGLLTGKVGVGGTKKQPHLDYHLSLSRGIIENVPARIEARGEYLPGIFNLRELKGKIGEKGEITASGTGEKESLDFTYAIKNFSLSHIDDNALMGILDFQGDIRGSLGSPEINYEKLARDIRINEFPVESFSSRGVYRDREVEISEGKISFDSGAVSILSGSLSLQEQDILKMQFDTRFENLSAGPAIFLGRAGIEGTVNTVTADFRGRLTPHTLLLNRYRVNNDVALNFSGDRLKVRVQDGLKSDIKILPEGFEISTLQFQRADSFLRATGVYANGGFEGSLKGSRIEIDHIIRLLNRDIDLRGPASMDADIKVTPESIDISGGINMARAVFRNMDINNINSRFLYSDGDLILRETYIRDPGYIDITAEGVLSSELDFDLKVDRLALPILKSASGEISDAGGYFTGEFKVRGPSDNPEVSGYAELMGGSLRGRNFFDRIEDIDAKITAEGSRLVVESFTARWVPSSLVAEGYIDFSKSPFDIDFLVKTGDDEGVNLQVPHLDIPQSTIFGRHLNLPSHGEPRGVVRFFAEDGKRYIESDIILANAHFTYPPAEEIDTPESPRVAFLDDVYLKLKVTAGRSVWYENTYARARVNGEAVFSKEPGGALLVNGLLYSDQGTVNYFNRDFNIQEVRVEFEDGAEYVSGSAVTGVSRRIDEDVTEDDEIRMRISRSRIADMEPEFSSTRFADTTTAREATELAVAGAKLEDLSMEERSMLMRRELLRAIDASLTTPLVQNILRQADLVDVAKVDIKFEEDIERDALQLRGAGLRLGRHLSDRFYMGYYIQYGLAMDNPLRISHELDMSYRLRESQFLKGRISGEEGFLGIEQRFRF